MTNDTPNLIEWNESYYIGVPRFDQEHVELMGMANAIIQSIHSGGSQSEVEAAFATLLARTCRHFDDEEAVMADTFYSHLAQHRSNHNELIRALVKFAAEARSGEVRAQRAGEFLLDWLLEHVLQADVYYAKHFMERGIR